MELANIQERLASFSEELTSQTYLNTYRVQPKASLLNYEGLGTRANSIWKMAQYIVAKNDGSNSALEDYLKGWRILVKHYKNQYLIIQTDDNNWKIYDSNCSHLGDNDFIERFLNKGTNKNSTKKQELIREKAAAKFVRLALKETIKEDKELSLLMQSPNISITAKRLNVGRFCIGCDCTQLPSRADDYDSEIVWNYNTKSYYLYLEWAPADVEAKFIPEYNNAYKSKFYICKDGGDFVLYQIVQDEECSRQQIYYGCPGSGKSHKVKKDTAGVNTDFVFRTTFHPDTDYASFVGCYKPTTTNVNTPTLGREALKKEFEEIDFTKDKTRKRIEFATKYAESFISLAKQENVTCNKIINEVYTTTLDKDKDNDKEKVQTNGFDTYFAIFIEQIANERAKSKSVITYQFLPQVFTNAYVQAWKNPNEKVYLIIEEINRGNCAQIFGDLFQLLDRDKNTGESEYPVKADKDLADYLIGVLGTDHEGIKDGELKLPSNLVIYATMNTSDQSLFPMDSAFKRRWDWEYVPIEYGKNKDSYNYIITIGDKPNEVKYRWVEFLKIVNEKIYDTTRSEDKQMGNFFIKKSIDAVTFVNKVMFYLWNEVCKEEYGTQRNFFRKGNEGKEEFKFTDLFGSDRDATLNEFMSSLNVPTISKETENSEA